MSQDHTHTIEALRDHLFATLAALRDKDQPMDLERARTISAVAQTVINTAKVEVDYLRSVGTGSSRFLEAQLAPAETPGIKTSVVHRVR